MDPGRAIQFRIHFLKEYLKLRGMKTSVCRSTVVIGKASSFALKSIQLPASMQALICSSSRPETMNLSVNCPLLALRVRIMRA
jgi:hypothetical protein